MTHFSLTALPVELQLRVVNAIDCWYALARSACVSRAFRQMVADINKRPVWRTAVTLDDPEDPRFNEEGEASEETILQQLKRQISFGAHPDLCLVFASPHWMDYVWLTDEDSLMQLIVNHVRLPPMCAIVICYTTRVIGCSADHRVELEGADCALALTLVHLPPGVKLHISNSIMPREQDMAAWRHDELNSDVCEPGWARNKATPPAQLPDGARPLLLMAGCCASNKGMQWGWESTMERGYVPGIVAAGGVLDEQYMNVSHAPDESRRDRLHPYRHMNYPIGQDRNFAESVLICFTGPNVDVHTVSIFGKTGDERQDSLQAGLERIQQELAPLPQGQASTLGCFMFISEDWRREPHSTEDSKSSLVDRAFPDIPIAGSFTYFEFGPLPEEEQAPGTLSGPIEDSAVLMFVRLRAPAA